jgi:hypothetical protein
MTQGDVCHLQGRAGFIEVFAALNQFALYFIEHTAHLYRLADP